jgi:copper(I)-binding protein
VTRFTRCLLLGTTAMLVAALAGCEAGADAPTLQFHPASNGTTTVVNGVRIDNAFVLGPALGSSLPVGGQAGVFLSLTTPNHDQLVSAAAPGTASSVTLTNAPVTLSAGAVVDMSGPAPQIVLNNLTSPLSGGETVKLALTFTTAGVVTLQVPVEPAAYEYTTYSPPPPPPPTPTPTPTGSHKGKARSARGSSASPAATP